VQQTFLPIESHRAGYYDTHRAFVTRMGAEGGGWFVQPHHGYSSRGLGLIALCFPQQGPVIRLPGNL
jgi:hypothetical protein